METISTTKENVFKIQHLKIEPQIELVEEEVKIVDIGWNCRARSRYRTTGCYVG